MFKESMEKKKKLKTSLQHSDISTDRNEAGKSSTNATDERMKYNYKQSKLN